MARRLDAQKWRNAGRDPLLVSASWARHVERTREFGRREAEVVRRLVHASPGISTPHLHEAYNQDRATRGLAPVRGARFHQIVHETGLFGRTIKGSGVCIFWFPASEPMQPQAVEA